MHAITAHKRNAWHLCVDSIGIVISPPPPTGSDDSGTRPSGQEHWRVRARRRQRYWSLSHGFGKGRKLADWGAEDDGSDEEPTVIDADEDAQLQAAITASLAETSAGATPSGGGGLEQRPPAGTFLVTTGGLEGGSEGTRGGADDAAEEDMVWEDALGDAAAGSGGAAAVCREPQQRVAAAGLPTADDGAVNVAKAPVVNTAANGQPSDASGQVSAALLQSTADKVGAARAAMASELAKFGRAMAAAAGEQGADSLAPPCPAALEASSGARQSCGAADDTCSMSPGQGLPTETDHQQHKTANAPAPAPALAPAPAGESNRTVAPVQLAPVNQQDAPAAPGASALVAPAATISATPTAADTDPHTDRPIAATHTAPTEAPTTAGASEAARAVVRETPPPSVLEPQARPGAAVAPQPAFDYGAAMDALDSEQQQLRQEYQRQVGLLGCWQCGATLKSAYQCYQCVHWY